MSRPTTVTPVWKQISWMVVWSAVILFWETLTAPLVSHSNSWQGVWISLGLLVFSAYHLAMHVRPSRLFVYGFAGAALFLPRFLGMDRFRLWTAYQAPADHVLILWWVCIAVGLGMLCWGAGQLHASNKLRLEHDRSIAPHEASIDKSDAGRLGIVHFMAVMACVGGYIGLMRALGRQRSFLAIDESGPFAVLWVFNAVGAGVTLFGLILFTARRIRGLVFPKYPGEFLLLALGVRTGFALAARTVLALLSSPETVIPSRDSYTALMSTGSLLAALILLAAAVHTRPLGWRIFLLSMALFIGVACFRGFGGRIFTEYYPFFAIFTQILLVVVVVRDLSRRVAFRWSHWLGIAVQFWFGSISAGFLFWKLLT